MDMSDKKDRDYFARHVGVCDPDDILKCVPELVDLVNTLVKHNRIKEISDLKAKNKELEEKLEIKAEHNSIYTFHLNEAFTTIDELLDALDETTKIHREIVKGSPVTFKDYLPLIESNQALITKYRV